MAVDSRLVGAFLGAALLAGPVYIGGGMHVNNEASECVTGMTADMGQALGKGQGFSMDQAFGESFGGTIECMQDASNLNDLYKVGAVLALAAGGFAGWRVGRRYMPENGQQQTVKTQVAPGPDPEQPQSGPKPPEA